MNVSCQDWVICMAGFVTNIEKETEGNAFYRKVLFTAKKSQLVVMSLKPGEEIGEETHDLDQFIRIEHGTGKAVLDGEEFELSDGFAVLIPEGTKHNILNTGTTDMKLYSVYAPPEHPPNTVHKTKADEPEHH